MLDELAPVIPTERLVTIVLPVMNEVDSLIESIDVIDSHCGQWKHEFLIVISPRTTQLAARNAEQIAAARPGDVRVLLQSLPGLGGAMIDAFAAAKGERIVMMSSDLETDPATVPEMLRLSDSNPGSIVATTRWRGSGAGFVGYGRRKQLANRVFQAVIRSLYGTSLSDLTYGFRLYPRESLHGHDWRTRNHAFLLESLLRPLRAGWPVLEIPARWSPRREGSSNNDWTFYASYFKVALLVRFGA